MKYLVVGGEGFIGYHLCSKLLEQDNEVVSFDNNKFEIPSETEVYGRALEYRKNHLNQYEQFNSYKGDANNYGYLIDVLSKEDPDVIIDLSSLVVAKPADERPYNAKKDIFDTTVTLLEVVRSLDLDLTKFVYTSSSMTYGNFLTDNQGNIIPASEDQPHDPIEIYGAYKYCGEILAKAYQKRYDIPTVCIKPSAVYGPTDCNQRVVQIFMQKLFRGEDLRLDGGGLHKLDFTYVKDLVDGMILASESGEESVGESFNITTGDGRTIKELADIIVNLYPNGIETYTTNANFDRPQRGTLSIEKARTILGYEPKYNLERGVQEYYEFAKETGIV